MLRYAAVAAILAVAACSDNATAPATAAPAAQYPVAVRYDTARGTIAARAADDEAPLQVFLISSRGDSLQLIGPIADVLASMPGTEFWVEGRLSAEGTMDVVSYAYRGADFGSPCVDPEHRVADNDGKCQIAETGIKRRKR